VRTAWRDDLIAVLAGGLLILGLFLDGWHHLYLANGQDGSFFTPWHLPLYAGFNACAIWTITRNQRLREMLAPRGAGGRRVAARPTELGMILVGLAVAAIGVVGDAIVRTTGARPDGEALAPPFNLLLFAGAGIVFVVAMRTVLGRAVALRAVAGPGRGAIDRRVGIAALAALGAAAIAFVAFGGTSPRERTDRLGSAVAARPITHAPARAHDKAAPVAAPAAHAGTARPASASAGRAAAATPRHRTVRRAAAAPHARPVAASHRARAHAPRAHARRAVPTPRVVVHRPHRVARPAPHAPTRRQHRRPAWRPTVVSAAPAPASARRST